MGLIPVLSADAPVILTGDWNASLNRATPTARDKKFRTFVQSAGLTLAKNTTPEPTYHGFNGTSSKIDYTFVHHGSFLSHGLDPNCVTMSLHHCVNDDPNNLSTHDLLGFKVTLPNTGSTEKISSNQEPHPIPIWETLDPDLYQSILHDKLTDIFSQWGSPETVQILASLIPKVFVDAAESSTKTKIPKEPKNFRKKKSKERWKAALSAREAYKKWKNSGTSTDPNNQLYQNKREARNHFREIVHNELLAEDIERNNVLMEARLKDSKKLSQIIKLSRNNTRGNTSMITINGREYTGDNQVPSGFFEFHKTGSTPPDVTQDPDDHLYRRATVDVTSVRYIL